MKIIVLISIPLVIIATFAISSTLTNKVSEEADKYIHEQIEDQRILAERQVDSLFVHKHTDIFPLYYECKSRYLKVDYIKQAGLMFKDIINFSNDLSKIPSDVTSTYYVAPEDPQVYTSRGISEDVKAEIRVHNVNNDGIQAGIQGVNWLGLWQTGWALGVRENFGGGCIVEYMIIPYAVSFRKQSFGTLEGYMTIDEILHYAFKFYTENEKSKFKKSIVTDTERFTAFPYIHNDYYYLEEKKEGNYVVTTIRDYVDYGTYMYDDPYYVFIKRYGQKNYELALNKDHVKNMTRQFIGKKRKSIVNNRLAVTIPLIFIWIVTAIIYFKQTRDQKRTLLQRIIIKCNPKKFLKNYDVDKIKSANDIYSKAKIIHISDEVGILELANKAEKELGVNFVTKRDIKKIRAICNPKLFMKPYDADRVARANEIYGRVKQGVLSYADYLRIKEEVEKLYVEKKRNPQDL